LSNSTGFMVLVRFILFHFTSITLSSHSCHTVVTLFMYSCYTVVTLHLDSVDLHRFYGVSQVHCGLDCEDGNNNNGDDDGNGDDDDYDGADHNNGLITSILSNSTGVMVLVRFILSHHTDITGSTHSCHTVIALLMNCLNTIVTLLPRLCQTPPVSWCWRGSCCPTTPPYELTPC
jgi:hypothetical protein